MCARVWPLLLIPLRPLVACTPHRVLTDGEGRGAPNNAGDSRPRRRYGVDCAAPNTRQPPGDGAGPAWNRGRAGRAGSPVRAGAAH